MRWNRISLDIRASTGGYDYSVFSHPCRFIPPAHFCAKHVQINSFTKIDLSLTFIDGGYGFVIKVRIDFPHFRYGRLDQRFWRGKTSSLYLFVNKPLDVRTQCQLHMLVSLQFNSHVASPAAPAVLAPAAAGCSPLVLIASNFGFSPSQAIFTRSKPLKSPRRMLSDN